MYLVGLIIPGICAQFGIFSFKEKKDSEVFKLAFKKAKSIVKELKNLPETKDNMEIDIINDIIDDVYNKSQKYDISSEQMDSFFYPFAVRQMSI